MKQKVNNQITLNQLLEDLKKVGAKEIKRILPSPTFTIVEWN